MAQIKEIRQRIKSVRSIEQITKAMKMVAAVKMKRAQDRILKARPYAYKLRQMLEEVAGTVSHEKHPLLRVRADGKILLMVVTGDKGLCGSFNTNILRRTAQILEKKSDQEIELVLVGRKTKSLVKTKRPIFREYIGIFQSINYDIASAIGDDLISRYSQSGIKEVIVVHNEFKSAMQQRVVEERILPLVSPGESVKSADYIFEPDADSLMSVLLPRTLKIQLYRMLLESDAAEQAARLTAMDSATNNAGEVIRSLTMKMNRIRQAGITREILEVVSGAEALK